MLLVFLYSSSALVIAEISQVSDILKSRTDLENCLKRKHKIVKKLACFPELKIVKIKHVSYFGKIKKIILLTLKQPTDHGISSSSSFHQRLTLHHVSFDRPMVFYPSGYSNNFSEKYFSLSEALNSNQIHLEHRFYGESVPSNWDWSLLNIEQASRDSHELVKIFKKIYKQKWVSSGNSKGGGAAIYHKYFYPNDVSGVVANGSPLFLERGDRQFNKFLKNIGGASYALCHDKLNLIQKIFAVNKRIIAANFIIGGDSLEQKILNLELQLGYMHVRFWKNNHVGNPGSCDRIFGKIDYSSSEQLIAFYEKYISPDLFLAKKGSEGTKHNVLKEDVKDYLYGYQVRTERGYPAMFTEYIQKELDYANDSDFINSLYLDAFKRLSPSTTARYSSSSMQKIHFWAENNAQNIIYIYGELDPFSASKFPKSKRLNSTYTFIVDGGNHGANFLGLNTSQTNDFMKIVNTWLK